MGKSSGAKINDKNNFKILKAKKKSNTIYYLIC